MFLTMVTIAFVMYHFHNEFQKEDKKEQFKGFD